jgi:WD40 repeat protein
MRAVTASDDQTVNFYHGVPFKFAKSISDHTRFVPLCFNLSRFVQCTRFSPSGDHFVTTGSDGAVFIYDGKTGEKVSQLAGHTGGVFSASWSPDGKCLQTVSADTSVRIWDIATASVVDTMYTSETPGAIEDQQVGSLWQGDYILSVSLSGAINYWDRKSARPSRVVSGHQKV